MSQNTRHSNVIPNVVPSPFQQKLATSAKAAPVMVVADVVPTTPQPRPEYLTLEEAAALLRVHHNSVRNAIKYNGLPAFRVGGGKNGAYRIQRTALEQWQAQQAAQAQK